MLTGCAGSRDGPVAGGARDHLAVRAALRAGWVNLLIRDLETAQRLLEDAGVPGVRAEELPELRPADVRSVATLLVPIPRPAPAQL